MPPIKYTTEQIAQLRYKARTDLYFLATEVLDNKDFIARIHKPMCDAFVHKKPGMSIAAQDTVKQRLILASRGHFKTTIDEADIIQWILLEPNIRILILSGKEEIVKSMIRNIKEHFQLNPKLRALFPELCPPENAIFGNQTEFTIPARTKRMKEPTVLATASQSVKAGLHFDIIKGDDLVNEINTATSDQTRKTTERWEYTSPIVEPYGYRDLIGTPYDEDDLYAKVEKKANVKTFKMPVWTVKPEYKEHLKSGKKLKAEMVNITFPERFTFDWLMDIRTDNPHLFNCQYLMDPTPEDMATFHENDLKSHLIAPNNIPHSGRVFQRWDFGFSEEKYSDFSVGVTGLYDEHGNLYILDIAFGKWGPHDLVNAIVTQAIKWRPARVGIEAAGGSKLIQPALEVKLRDLQHHINVDWFKTSPTKHKTQVIAALEPLLLSHKLYFSMSIPSIAIAECFKQFMKFPKGKHDDIPDAIAGLLEYRGSVDIIQPFRDDEPEPTYSESDYIMGYGLNAG